MTLARIMAMLPPDDVRSPCGSWQSQQNFPPIVASVCFAPSCAVSALVVPVFLAYAPAVPSGSTPFAPVVAWQSRQTAFGEAVLYADETPFASVAPRSRYGLFPSLWPTASSWQ